MLISNVGCSILASIIYDISKVCLGKFKFKREDLSIEKINVFLQKRLDNRYEIIYTSGEFISFSETPFFKDIIENYIIYKITGNYEGNIIRIKKNNANLIVEKDIIDYLSAYLFQEYFNETLTKPSKKLIHEFFESFFKVSANYIVSFLREEDKMNVFLINRRIDMIQENILLRMDETIETIKRTMKCEFIPVESKYKDYVKEYHNILKTNNSKAHVYLLDTFTFSEFYVPPFLRELSPKQEIREHLRWMRRDYLMYTNEGNIKNEYCFDDWKYIFDYNNIIYVTGGAGYGKSLFLKKIINDFCNMNMLNSSEYLVIYGDLKAFYIEGEQPISLVKFLQNSMQKETLMDEKYLSIDMIEYYIKMGRCLILLDALDEVEKQKREYLHKRIVAYFKNQNPNNRVCITSRNRGFIPEKDVEVFDILPLDRTQIETYVDNIIKLGRFDPKDKQAFLEQSKVLVEKGFLNSFLVLSLLINIYKAERELPENKMELYQKCFDYIAYRREKEKTKAKFDWNLISCMMKDNTFMELAKMCFPNNSDIGKNEIVDMLCKTYGGKFTSMAETERAAENFLAFCSDRTELFVPAAGEDRYKFFHRSFFEYFYAQYIFLRIKEIENVYKLLENFDVDSEVFELTFAMMKQKDEPRYQQLVEYIFNKIDEETKINKALFNAFNILTLGMQVVDDNVYICRYVDYLLNNKEVIIKNIKNIPNQWIIYSIITHKVVFINKVNQAYEDSSKLEIIKWFLEEFSEVNSIINNNDFNMFTEENRKHLFKRRVNQLYENAFYVRLYSEYVDYADLLSEFTKDDLNRLFTECKVQKKVREKYRKLFFKYLELSKEKQELLQKELLYNPNREKSNVQEVIKFI